MNIDLPGDECDSVCRCCEGRVARLLDRDLGPVCHECFGELLWVHVTLGWIDKGSPAANAGTEMTGGTKEV
jgi:hypothetical protein